MSLHLKIICVFSLLLVPQLCFAQFAGGDGSGGSPYQITSCTQLQAMKDALSSNFILKNDIDCSDTVNWNSGAGFLPVGHGFFTTPFTGLLDGDGHIIRNLFINRPGLQGVGLFGWGKGTIRKVGLVDVNITGSDRVGGLIGDFGGNTTVSDCFVTGSVTAGNDGGAGGLAGRLDNGADILRSYAYVTVTTTGSNSLAGGLFGFTLGATGSVQDSFAAGPATAADAGAVGGHITDFMTDIQFSRTYFDVTRTGLTQCDSLNFAVNCTGVNTASAEPSYFFANSSNEPLAQWNFTTVWKHCSDSFPVFLNSSCTGALSDTNVQPANLLRSVVGDVTVTFKTSRAIANSGKIRVTFPAGFVLSSGGATVASSPSGIPGTYTDSVVSRTYTLTRTSGATIAAGTTVSFTLSNVANPAAVGPAGTYAIVVRDSRDVAVDSDESVSADSIACPSGTFGSSCSDCPGGSSNPCNGQGTCDEGASGSGLCSCSLGFTSSDCSLCSGGYFGNACSQCPGGGNCSGNGTCDSGISGSGVCSCDTGFTGTDCASCTSGRYGNDCLLCPGNGNCSGHGTCNEGATGNGVCSCAAGYSGADCATEIVQKPAIKTKVNKKNSKKFTFTCNIPTNNAPVASYKFFIKGPISNGKGSTKAATKSTNTHNKTFKSGGSYEVWCSYTTSGNTISTVSGKKKFKL